MRNVKIVADSSCDLFELGRVDFATAPMKVITDEREFVDTPDLDVHGMTDFLYQYKGKSKSSCPNTSDWLDAFGDAEEVFCVTITSNLSGSYNSACAAKAIYEADHAGRRVHVFDTLSAGPEMALIIEELEDCVARGVEFDEICAHVTDYMRRTGLVFMLRSVKNFVNNGRVSPLVGKLVGIAGIRIIGKASDEGTLQPVDKCRGERRSLEALVAAAEAEGYRCGKLRIGHCQNEEEARRLEALFRERFPDTDITVREFRGLCSFYAEKGGVLIGFEKA